MCKIKVWTKETLARIPAFTARLDVGGGACVFMQSHWKSAELIQFNEVLYFVLSFGKIRSSQVMSGEVR